MRAISARRPGRPRSRRCSAAQGPRSSRPARPNPAVRHSRRGPTRAGRADHRLESCRLGCSRIGSSTTVSTRSACDRQNSSQAPARVIGAADHEHVVVLLLAALDQRRKARCRVGSRLGWHPARRRSLAGIEHRNPAPGAHRAAELVGEIEQRHARGRPRAARSSPGAPAWRPGSRGSPGAGR